MLDLIKEGLWGTPTAKGFTYFLIAAFVIALVFYLKSMIRRNGEKMQWINSHASAILTSIGLFGTFFGVAVGLGGFDSSNINESVPTLLESMKLAFWTSILGMFGALILNLLHFFVMLRAKPKDEGADGAADIRDAIDANGAQLRAIVDAIGGGGDGSLLTQIHKLRNDTTDFKRDALEALGAIDTASKNSNSYFVKILNAIGQANVGGKQTTLLAQIMAQRSESQKAGQAMLDGFNSFAAKMAENNMKSVTDALEKVMLDFNAKINDKLGKNFEQLDATIGELIRLQQDHQEAQRELIEQFTIAQDGIAASKDAIAAIKSDLDSVPATMDQLKQAAIEAHRQISDGAALLNGITSLSEKAKAVVPTIQDLFEDLTKSLKERLAGITRQLENDMRSTSDKMKESVAIQNAEIQKISSSLTDTTLQVQNVIRKGVDTLQQDFTTSAENIRNAMEKSFKQLDDAMTEVHTESIRNLGVNTATLYKKILDDMNNCLGQIDGAVSKISQIAKTLGIN